MEERRFDLSPRSLRRKLIQSFRSKGVIDELKTNIRQRLIAEIQFESKESRQNNVSLNDDIAFNLCLEYLHKLGYYYTISVLLPEAGRKNSEKISREHLMKLLKIDELATNCRFGERLTDFSKSLIYNISSFMIVLSSIRKLDKFCQTESEFETFNLGIELDKIDAKYNSQYKIDAETLKHRLEEHVFNMRCKIEEEIFGDYCKKLDHFKQYTQLEMKKGLEISSNAMLKEKQMQLEEAYSVRRSALEERENHLNEMLSKSKEANRRAAFLQRQTLLAEIEAARAQTDKYRQLESDLQRQRKDLQDEYNKRRAVLQAGEEKLLSREQEFDEIVRQEVDRLRKSDEMELLNKRKQIEVTEFQIKIEKDAMDARLKQILSLQREVAEKSALFSEMEIIDYQTIKTRLNSSNNEVNVLKRRLKEAFEEIEQLREDSATALVEKSLLASIRQENSRLRDSLENERTERNQERAQINQKMEELRMKKDKLEEKIRSQESELERLRVRLADQCDRPAEANGGTSSSGFATHSDIPTASAVAIAPSNTASATIKTARERLQALESEYTQIEEALGRWRAELLAVPPSASSNQASSIGDVSEAGLPRNSLAAAYLGRFRGATSIPGLRQLPHNWSIPYVRKIRNIIESVGPGGSEQVSPFSAVLGQKLPSSVQHVMRGGTAMSQQSGIGQPSNLKVPPRGVVPSLSAFCTEDFESNDLVKSAEVPTENRPQAFILDPSGIHSSDFQKKGDSNSCDRLSLKNMEDNQTYLSSQCFIQHDARETELDVYPEINKGSARRDSVILDEESKNGILLESSDHSVIRSTPTDIPGRAEHGSNSEHDNIAESGNGISKLIEDFTNREKEEKAEITSEAPSNTGVNPMVLKYVKIAKDKNVAEEPGKVMRINADEPHENARFSFTAFLLTQESNSDLSESEKECAESGTKSVGGKSGGHESSDFW